MNEHVNLVVEQYELRANETEKIVKYHGEVAKDVHGGLVQRLVEVKSIKQYAKDSFARCGIKLFEEYRKCVLSTGRFYGKVPRFGSQLIPRISCQSI